MIAQIKRITAGASVAVFAMSANAAAPTFDITPVTDALTAGTIAIAAIGAAMLGFYAIKKVWRMVRP